MKLGNLLKKELKELLTVQALFSMVFTCLLLVMMGQIMGSAMDEALFNTTVNIVNYDTSDFTDEMLKKLPEYGADVNLLKLEKTDDYSAKLAELEITNLVVIPENFGESVMNGSESAQVQCISLINKTGLSSTMSDLSASTVTSSINDYVSDYLQNERFALTEEEQVLIESPIVTVEYTAANGKTLQISSTALSSMLMMQSFIAPFAVFFLILMASQMIMTAISTEKIDKTLETLMSAPVSRITVLTAKMLAALIVALLNAASMIIGFIFYMQGMMGGAIELETAEAEMNMGGDIMNVADAMMQFGFTLTAADIVLFGIQLFLTIAIGLSFSLILGAMATDTKSVQTLVLPIMLATMIPFFVTMFADVNSLSAVPKAIMYIIPFTHTYTAMNNLMFGNTALFWIGLVYQLIFFVVCMYLAVRVFTTDLLFTMNFNPDNASFKKKKAVKGAAK